MVERVELAEGLEICRVITGLWQIADMEKTGDKVSCDQTAAVLSEYCDAGFDTFDMAGKE